MKKNLTDEGRTIIRRDGSEESISARGNWSLWKFTEDLNIDELEALYKLYSDRYKYEPDELQKRAYRRDILIINDRRRIKQRLVALERDEVDFKGEIKRYGLVILGQLGFNCNDIYKKELDNITDLLTQTKYSIEFFNKYNDELIASVIITEILDYYNSKYNIEDIYSIVNIDENEYIKLKLTLNSWLISNYWKEISAIQLFKRL